MNCKVQRWESFSPHGYDVKKLAIAIGLTVMGSIANASILWDYGWTMGTETGGWSNSTAFQNFAEKVSFASDVSVTRFMTYTNFDPTSFGTMFVKLLSDIAGVPDAVASWTNVSGDINEVNLDLSTPFTLTAGSATQHSAQQPLVQMRDMVARLQLTDGPGEVTAGQGTYDLKLDSVYLAGPVQFQTGKGYKMVTSAVTVDLKRRRAFGMGGVTGQTSAGSFSADRIASDLSERTITLDGRARLRMTQGHLNPKR